MFDYIRNLDQQKLNKLCSHLIDPESSEPAAEFTSSWELSKVLISAILSRSYSLTLFPAAENELTVNLIAPTVYQQSLFTGDFPLALAQAGAAVCLLEKFGCGWCNPEVNQAVQDFLA